MCGATLRASVQAAVANREKAREDMPKESETCNSSKGVYSKATLGKLSLLLSFWFMVLAIGVSLLCSIRLF